MAPVAGRSLPGDHCIVDIRGCIALPLLKQPFHYSILNSLNMGWFIAKAKTRKRNYFHTMLLEV